MERTSIETYESLYDLVFFRNFLIFDFFMFVLYRKWCDAPLCLCVNSFNLFDFQECFHMEETMGIIGGRPNSAYYFIGYQG